MDPLEILFRIGMALGAGLLLGLEREGHGRAAGLKTTTLASVAAAMAIVLSEAFFYQGIEVLPVPRNLAPDRLRLAAGILTGMGFLGAGVIIRQGSVVRGVTTAAVLWYSSILGLVFGSGLVLLGVVGLVIAIFSLYVLPRLEAKLPRDWYVTVKVTGDIDGLSYDEVRTCLKTEGAKVQSLEMDYDLTAKEKTLTLLLKMHREDAVSAGTRIMEKLVTCSFVSQVRWH